MPLLHIALQDGFAGDPVSITVDGREIFRKDRVRTMTQIGRADDVETRHDAGPVSIDIKARNSSSTITHTLAGDTFIGVSLTQDGRITHRISQEAFRYM
ncbi:MAG TPA: hypothetical protein VFJ02_11305 [Vicinamibacterales bacterium]|nr:hypothetical protein [Vicinamibacterales bacterium]